MPTGRMTILLMLFCLLLATPLLAQENPLPTACGLPLTGAIVQSTSYNLTSHCERWESLVVDKGAHVTIHHNGYSFQIAIGDGMVTTLTPAGLRIDRSSGVIHYIAGQVIGDNSCERMLGAIASICLVAAPERAHEIWGTGHFERSRYLLRVTQREVDAVAPGQHIASSDDGRIAMRVEHDGHITLSMGPDQEGKVHHVTLEHTLSGRIIASAVTYDGPPGEQTRPRRSAAVIPQPAQMDGSIVHVVQPGHTLFAIARAYDVTLQEIIERNAIANRGLIHVGQELLIRADRAAQCARYEAVAHVAGQGENIVGIARAYDLNPTTLAIRNGLPDLGRRLSVGQGLIIPERWTLDGVATELPAYCADIGPVIHFVRSGDTLEAIAMAYAVDMLAIIEGNRLPDDGVALQPGQGLVIREALPSAAEDSEAGAGES
ncbi:MAG: LysM peptidoglycan-binding domain-containing protein [Anaerolineaceae bacterium]|nr:LysM peptidoglycan-binding domain-containing protein [Anaerolineaceae bacterium]